MLTPDNIIVSFVAPDTFEPVVGAPTNDNVYQVLRTVVGLLQSICYQIIQDSLSGLIESEAKYRDWSGHAFDRLETADKDEYDPNMPSNPDIGKRSQCKDVFKAKKACPLLISTAHRFACLSILSVVEETWVSELEDSDTYLIVCQKRLCLTTS